MERKRCVRRVGNYRAHLQLHRPAQLFARSLDVLRPGHLGRVDVEAQRGREDLFQGAPERVSTELPTQPRASGSRRSRTCDGKG